jgi:prophage regulatory protein
MNIIMDRLPVVEVALGKSRSTIYADVDAGLLTPSVQIGKRAVAWPRHEHQAVAAARIMGKSDEEIRELVRKLVADRSAVAKKLAGELSI